jgi:hypothetical protein
VKLDLAFGDDSVRLRNRISESSICDSHVGHEDELTVVRNANCMISGTLDTRSKEAR